MRKNAKVQELETLYEHFIFDIRISEKISIIEKMEVVLIKEGTMSV